MKHTYLKVLSLLLIAIITTNCEKEEEFITSIDNAKALEQDHPTIGYISGETIPDVMSLLELDNNLSLKSSGGNRASIPFGSISTDNILAVADTLGNQNYSFALIPKSPKPHSIFNLVVSTVKGGQEIAIMEYRMAPSFAEDYRKGNVTLETFTGSILKHPFTAANTKLFAKGDTCQDEAINCDVTNVSNGNVVNSYGGNSEGASTINTGNTNTFTGANGADITHNYGGPTTGGHQGTLITVVYADNCSCPGGGSRGDESRIAYIKITPFKHTNKSGITKKGENCCDNTNIGGSIGINLLSNQVNDITNCITDLTQSQVAFLNSTLHSFTIKTYLENHKNPDGSCNATATGLGKLAIEALQNDNLSVAEWLLKEQGTHDQLKDLSDFLKAHDFSNEARAFAELAIETFIDGGEVDFDLKMIIEINETVEFQNQKCLKQIKDEVANLKQISKIIKKFEPTHPVLHLEWGLFGNTDWGNTGQTSLNKEQNTAFININRESLTHVSNIVMVKTIAHEIIHAELYRKLKELVDDYRIISLNEYIDLQDNYLGIANYTSAYGEIEAQPDGFGGFVFWGLTPDYSKAHHNQMADFYRGTLIDAMKEYDTLKGITRSNAEEFYEALSWAGLRGFSDENDNTQYYDAWKEFKKKIDKEESNIPVENRTYNKYIDIANKEYNNSGIKCN